MVNVFDVLNVFDGLQCWSMSEADQSLSFRVLVCSRVSFRVLVSSRVSFRVLVSSRAQC